MTTVSKQLLEEQWRTLHNNHENYENYESYALIIKLVATAITLFVLTFSIVSIVILLLLAILWLQEGIRQTYQQRTVNAIIAIVDKLDLNESEQTNELMKPY